MKKLLLFAAAIGAVICIVIAGVNMLSYDYERADKKTRALESCSMNISTIVSIKRGAEEFESIIDQNLLVENKGRKDMRYEVVTNVTGTESTGKRTSEESRYLYSDGMYYYTYPNNLKYKSSAEHDAAEVNIEKLMNVISFDFDKMYNLVETETEEGIVYEYGVDFADVSEHVKTMLQNALEVFEAGDFKMKSVGASATIAGEHVIKREFSLSYENEAGDGLTMDIYTELVSTKAKVEKPNEDEFPMV